MPLGGRVYRMHHIFLIAPAPTKDTLQSELRCQDNAGPYVLKDDSELEAADLGYFSSIQALQYQLRVFIHNGFLVLVSVLGGSVVTGYDVGVIE
ncbi:hypothetical protein PC116_g26580 [Phytophthora cactorum]|nr:hypothetical protein PC114_g20303 [Phytophthora cactorum]KAG2988593.1 hypothetical protein PC119_g19491 [Phytophthora cactorum]KAG4224977.1 hypothetical protein PC116_g26580 [Phytophthora cactorum]